MRPTTCTAAQAALWDLLEGLPESERRRGWQAVGEMLGMDRSTVSTLARGRYPADPSGKEREVLAAVARLNGRVLCPHLAKEIGGEECDRYRNRPMPRSNAPALRHWGACQDCPVGDRRKAQQAREAAAAAKGGA